MAPINYNFEASFIGTKIRKLVSQQNKNLKMKVQSVFNKVINVQVENGLYSIVSAKVGRAATYCAIPEDLWLNFNNMNIRESSNVYCLNNVIFIENDIAVDCSKSLVWEALVNDEFIWSIEDIDLEKLSALKSVLHRNSPENSAYRRMYKDVNFRRAISGLKDISTIEKVDMAASSLIGYGPGLTPTGDDLILGFICVANHCSQYAKSKDLLAAGIKRFYESTNIISKNMLAEAIEQNYHEFLDDLIYSLVNREIESIVSSCKKLLTMGATSGSDIATGIYLALLYAKDWQQF